jgi:prevent-host-death family protein
MRVSVSQAKEQLTDLVQRAETGDEIILTLHGRDAVRLLPVKRKLLDPVARRKLLKAISNSGAARAAGGPSAARSQDFLYDQNGLPKESASALRR